MGIYEMASTALLSHVGTLALTDWEDELMPIYYPEVVKESEPKPDGTHLVLNLLKTDPVKLDTSSSNKTVSRKWILQITLKVRDGIGIVKPDIVIDKIVDAFPVAGMITGSGIALKITKPATTISRLASDAWVSYPVQVTVLHIS